MDLSNYGQFSFGRSILVIPDAHARPGERPASFDRFMAIGNAVRDLRPDYVVCLGDLGDFNSLRRPAGEARHFDGDAALRDVAAFRAAMKAITSPTRSANKRHRQNRHPERGHEPVWIFCEGNHEERWRRWGETKLLGHDHIERIVVEDGWNWVPFLEVAWISNVGFTHYVMTGAKRQPAGLPTMLKKHRSMVCGHEHIWDMRRETIYDAGFLTALKAGCCKDEEHTDTNAGEWSGLTLLSDVQPSGSFAVQQIPYLHLLEKWGELDRAKELRVLRGKLRDDLFTARSAWS